MQRRCNAAVVSCVRPTMPSDGPAGVGSAPRARRCRSRGCSPRGPRASAPTTWPRSSARASRPPTTCSSACATRAWPCTTPAACTGSRRRSREMVTTAAVAPADELHDLSGVVSELLARTHKRSYLGGPARRRAARRARARAAGDAEAARARSRASPTTPTRWRSARSCSRWPRPRSSSATCRPGCGASRAHTITDPDALRDELREVAPPRLRGRARGVRRRLLLHRRAGARCPRALPRGDRDLDDAPGLRRGARDARADRRRRRRLAGRTARPPGRRTPANVRRSAPTTSPDFQPSAETPVGS